MGLFKNLFGNQFKKENYNHNDEIYDDWADPLTKGWEYTCNLDLKTPKICLENDGMITEGATKPELFGEPNQIGKDGEPTGIHGSWTRRMGYEEIFDKSNEISENIIYARSSDIGKIPYKSQLEKDFKGFLIEFRSIVESYIEIEKKISKINNDLPLKSNIYSNFYKKLVIEKQFPDSFFKEQLSLLNGVNSEIASVLWDAGYLTPQYVLDAPDDELLMIKGIDRHLISQIRR